MEGANRQRQALLLAMNAGRILLENGAEISRVEETVDRICRHYGLKSASAFILSNGIFLTSGSEEDAQFARVQFIPNNNTNLNRVAEVNQLSRQIEQNQFTLSQAQAELERIESIPDVPARIQIPVAGISAACFSVMFGGGFRDAMCCVVIGSLLYVYLLYLGKPRFSRIVCNILGSAWVTFLCILGYKLNLGRHLEAMMIGCIILMMPGVPFTNAIRDMAEGDYISGSVRMLDAVLVFLCIAMGVGFVFSLYTSLTGGTLL